MPSNRRAYVRQGPGKYLFQICIFILENDSLLSIGFVNRVERLTGLDLNHDGWVGGMPYYPYGYSVVRRYHTPATSYGIYQPYRYVY